MEMKKELNPMVMIGVIVVVLAVAGFAIYSALTSTSATVSTTTSSSATPPAMINGKPVPPGVPYDYAQKMSGGNRP